MAFRLFATLFGGSETHGKYPESLVDMATERAVDGVYPRLKVLPGYKKRLRPSVIRAIDHVIDLVDSLPPAVPAGATDFSGDSRLRALFVSPDHLRETFGRDADLGEFRERQAAGVERVFALLLAERKEKNVLGIELAGERVNRDVAQVTVSFGGHRLLEPHADEAESRRRLKHRAFDHLVTLALSRVTEAKSERADLGRQRDLLKAKLGMLKRSGCGFEAATESAATPQRLQDELDALEEQLAALKIDDKTLEGQLDVIADVLGDPAKHFWAEDTELWLDRMNIRRSPGHESAQRICFRELANARGRRLSALMVSVKLDELPKRKTFAENADRVLAEVSLPHQKR